MSDSVSEKEFLQEFEVYKTKHHEFFPEGTPLEKQHAYFQVIKQESERLMKEREDNFHKLDDAVENKDCERLAREVYQSGKFLDQCVKTFMKVWLGDVHVLKGIIYQATAFKLENADEGIHIHVSGITQSGKSDSVKTSLKFIPPGFYENRTFSPKWIFHAEAQGKIHENMILFSDDTILDPEVSALYRNILTSWHEGVVRGTVINNKAVDLTIPKHVSLILTSLDNVVEESQEGQDESRFLTLEVRRSKDQEKEIREFIQKVKIDVSEELKAIHTIWSVIPIQKVSIHKVIDKICTIRELKRYFTLLKCNALLHNRAVTNDTDIIEIDQFLAYSKPMIDAQTPAHKRDEAAILSVLNNEWTYIEDIKKETGLSYARVVRGLHGRFGTFENPSGGLLMSARHLKMEYNPTTRGYAFSVSYF